MSGLKILKMIKEQTMIRADILSEILEVEVTRVWLDDGVKNMLYYATEKSAVCNVNIHELAFKSKIWAHKHEWDIVSGTWYDKYIARINMTDIYFTDSNSEVEAIFNATEWVYKQIKRGKEN